MISLLPYGLKNGNLISIHEVESGLKCNCTCPACGGPLVARKGKVKAHHFAHHQEGNCQGAVETALHLAAKEILEEHKKIVLPLLFEYDEKYTKTIIILSEPFEANLDEVRLEESKGNFKPDVVGVIQGREIYIEVAVTHFVDQEKEQKVREKGVSMVEIDLSDLMDGFTKEELIQEVIYAEDNKFWVYNAKQKTLFEKKMAPIIEAQNKKEAQRKQQQEIEEIERRKEAEEIEREEQLLNEKQINAEIKGLKLYSIGFHICRYLISKSAKKYRENEIITKLNNGVYWNGEIYGKGNNGRYIYLDSEQIYIFPFVGAIPLTAEEDKKKRRLYGQLMNISRESAINREKCIKCPYFDSFLDESKYRIFCGYAKGIKNS